MKELEEIEVYLCDNKPSNILVVMDSESAEKYHLKITDFDGAWNPNIIKGTKYPRFVTELYFNQYAK